VAVIGERDIISAKKSLINHYAARTYGVSLIELSDIR